jgi:hypothetical protein
VGWYNQATLTGDEYEELFIGFGGYSAQGMALFCAFICAVYGGMAGAASGASAWASGRLMVGLAVSVALSAVLWAATDLFHDTKNQAGLVWCFGMLVAGSVAGGLVWAESRGASQKPGKETGASKIIESRTGLGQGGLGP